MIPPSAAKSSVSPTVSTGWPCAFASSSVCRPFAPPRYNTWQPCELPFPSGAEPPMRPVLDAFSLHAFLQCSAKWVLSRRAIRQWGLRVLECLRRPFHELREMKQECCFHVVLAGARSNLPWPLGGPTDTATSRTASESAIKSFDRIRAPESRLAIHTGIILRLRIPTTVQTLIILYRSANMPRCAMFP